MNCIYCGVRAADGREHYLPQCFGRFENYEPLLDRICQKCNEEFGGGIERVLCRRSGEAIVRSMGRMDGQRRNSSRKRRDAQLFSPQRIGGKHIYFFAPDPNTGFDILWQFDPSVHRGVREISQIVILNNSNEPMDHLPIPTLIATREDFRKFFDEAGLTAIDKGYVVTALGDEERIDALLREIGAGVTWERRRGGPVSGRSVFLVEADPEYFRALAKIGFHYALKFIPTITGVESVFQPIREFIRYGIGSHETFLTRHDAAEYTGTAPGHLLAVHAQPEGSISANIQLFVASPNLLPRWTLNLGRNPTVLWVTQKCAHFFALKIDDDHRLRGDRVMEFNVRY